MKQNLLFNQATAIGKRLAMVLTMLLIVGIGQVWAETATYTLNSSNNGGSVTTGNVSWSIASGAITVQNSNCKLTGTITVTLPAGATLNKVSIAKSNTWGSGATVTFKTGSTTLNTFSNSGDYTLTTNKDKLTYTFTKSGTSSKNAWVKSITVDYTIVSSGGGNTGDDNTGSESDCDVWKLVTDASELKVGDEIVIAAANADVAMSKNANTNNNENKADEEITKSGNTIIINSFVQTITLENGTKNETFAFNTGSSYLYAASSSANHLKTKSTLDDNGSWSISITSEGIATIKAQGSNTRNWLRYNGSSSLFSCYASGQTDVSIYKYVECTAKPTYSVTYNGNGNTSGSVPTGATEYAKDAQVTVLGNTGNLAKTGYTFSGWNTKDDGTGTPYTAGETFTITEETTLYAQWTANTHTITLDANGGSGNTTSVAATYDSSTLNPSSITNPTKTGHTFGGWYSGEGGTGSLVINTSGKLQANVSGYTGANGVWKATTNETLYAKWTPSVYTITYKDQGNATFSGTHESGNPTQHTYGTETTLKGATKTGYTFGGWYKEATCTNKVTSLGATEYTANITLYAQWTANTYTVKFDGNGSDGGSMTDQSFTYGQSQALSANAFTRTNYSFKHWTINQDGTGISYTDKQSVSNLTAENGATVTLYAQWTPTYTITWLANEQVHHTQTAVEGTTLQMPSTPADGSYSCDDKVFVGWTENQISGSTNTKPADLFTNKSGTLTVNKTYYAVFATVEGGGETAELVKMTADDDFNIGDKIVIIAEGTQYGLYQKTTTSNYIDYWTTEDKDGVPTLAEIEEDSKKYVEVSAGTATGTIKLGDATNGYLYNSSSTNMLISTENSSNWSIIAWTDDTFTFEAGQYLSCRTDLSSANKNKWRGAGSSCNCETGDNCSGVIYYNVYKYISGSTASYSGYTTTCVALPDPVLSFATEPANPIVFTDAVCGGNSSKQSVTVVGENLRDVVNVSVTGPYKIARTSSTPLKDFTPSLTLDNNTTTGAIYSNYQTVYIISTPPAQSTEATTGTLTFTTTKGNTLTVNLSTPTVTCTQYTLTLNDRGTKTTAEYYAGASVPKPEDPEGVCTDPIHYVFDGWAEATVAAGATTYTKVSFPYTMPKDDQTLYAVYRYAEEGGEPVNGYVKVTEALADWSGDYVIVNETAKKAIGNAYKTDSKNDKTLFATDVTIIDNKIHNPTDDVIWQIRKSGLNYTMYNADASKYAYITGGDSENAGLSDAVQYINISWGSSPTTVRVIGSDYSGRCFSYYTNGNEWRTYAASGNNVTGALYKLSNKSLLYTSSLICGEISVEEDNVVVTSTKDQTVKVYVPITLKYSGAASITGTSDNEAFTVVTKNDVAVGESTIEVHYKPTAYVNTANQEETATITLTTSNAATTTFNVTGRCLPETFAIVAKVGNIWYALPSQGLNSETTPVGYPVKVDNNDNPTVVTSLPTKAEWALRNVYKVNGQNDRFAANGENLVFVNAENKTLYANNGNANIQTYAEYTNYAQNNPDRYEWVPTTTDLVTYTLKNVGRAKELSINVNATFGTHASNIASNNLRFLPINATYNPFDMQVVEWYPTKVLVQTEATLASVSATIGGVAVANPVVTKKGGKLYEISGLPLENNPTKILTISYDSYSCSKVVPIIISRATKSVTEAPFTTLTTSAYNYSDLVVRDGATLTINGTKQAPDKFVNVTIYPTAKIVVPENNQLNVYSLTFFGGIDDIYDGEEYTTNKYGVPQLSLKGTLGKTVTTMDYIMRVDLDQMYSLGVPYDVALADIKYWDGSAIVLGDQLYVSAYDGQARANREKQTWIYETDFETKIGAATLKAGIGYTISAEPQVAGDTYSILRMPMKSNISSGSTEEDKTVSVTGYANTKGATITDNHKGWNLLSNPYMTTISGDMGEDQLVIGYLIGTNWVADTYRYVTIPGDNGKWYYQQKFTDARLLPFKSFFVQVKEDVKDGNLSFALASRQNAPARFLQQDIVPREVEFELLLSNETQSDNMGLLISEEYTPAYEINADLEKMTGTMSVYTIYNGYTLAYNALSPLNAEEQIPVGYIVPANGEYTFDLKEDGDYDKVEHIYLIDREMDAMVDLLEETYDFYAVEKKNNNRFAISVILKSEQSDGDITTNLGEIDIHNKQPQKFFYDGELYILHDGKVYSATGHEIKTINE